MYKLLNMPDPTLLVSPHTGADSDVTQSPIMGISNTKLDFKTRWYFEMEKGNSLTARTISISKGNSLALEQV